MIKLLYLPQKKIKKNDEIIVNFYKDDEKNLFQITLS